MKTKKYVKKEKKEKVKKERTRAAKPRRTLSLPERLGDSVSTTFLTKDYRVFGSKKDIYQHRKDPSKIFFMNKDCVTCFSLGNRELHYILDSILSLPSEYTQHLFPHEIFSKRGTGTPLVLSYYQFFIIGIMKTFNDSGFTYHQAITLISQLILPPNHPAFESESAMAAYLSTLPDLYLYLHSFKDSKRLSKKLQLQDKYSVSLGELPNNTPLFDSNPIISTIKISFIALWQIIANYVENYPRN